MSSAPRATVRHAVIPCTRQDGVELLPVAGVPIVEWIARECAASGTSELLVVTGPASTLRDRLAPHVGSPGFPLRIEFASLPAVPSFGDAIRLGMRFANDGPLGVAEPTNLFVGDAPGLAQVVESYYRTGRNIVGVVGANPRVSEESRGTSNGDEVEIGPTLEHAVGRYVFTEAPDGHDRATILRGLLDAGRLVGRRMRGEFLDVSTPAGFESANRVTIRPPRPSAPTGRIE
jgi:NDP-sugar pyrophosphorylase family protein